MGELHRVAPRILILLGTTAARSLLGKALPVTAHRGLLPAPHLAPRVILTTHPAYLLRLPAGRRDEEAARFRHDLALGRGEPEEPDQ